MRQQTESDLPQPMRDGVGATIMGPHNVPLERENPHLLASPDTDAGTIPNLKFSFSAAHNRLLSGGWSREVTVRELPISTTMAGVDMRLKPGAIRELHWHKEAEWAYMLSGHVRVTAIDAEGRNFIDDVGVGGLWNFRAGLPHSIQALADGCDSCLSSTAARSPRTRRSCSPIGSTHPDRGAGQEPRRQPGHAGQPPARPRSRALHPGTGAGAPEP